MQLLDLYVGEDIRRLALERVSPAAEHTTAWHATQRVRRRAMRDAALLWLGDQFVVVGERLRGWSTAGEAQLPLSQG